MSLKKYAISACILPAIADRVCEGCIQVQHIEIQRNLNQNFPLSFSSQLSVRGCVCVCRLTSSKSTEQYIWKTKCRSRNCEYFKHSIIFKLSVKLLLTDIQNVCKPLIVTNRFCAHSLLSLTVLSLSLSAFTLVIVVFVTVTRAALPTACSKLPLNY